MFLFRNYASMQYENTLCKVFNDKENWSKELISIEQELYGTKAVAVTPQKL